MNVLIVDDDIQFSKQLSKDFLSYFSYKNNLSIEIKNTDFFDIHSTYIDIALLDIDLQIKNGIDFGEFLRKLFPKIIIIFVSAREDMVFNTFSAGVFQFIRKSQYEHDSKIVFDQLKKYLKKRSHFRTLTINGRVVTINLNDVQYIIALGQDIIIKSGNGNHTLKSSIKDILSILDCSLFVQIQRGIVVNFNYLKVVQKNKVITADNVEYVVGRKYRNSIIKKYEDYLLDAY